MAICDVLQSVDSTIMHDRVVVPEALCIGQRELVVVLDPYIALHGVHVKDEASFLWPFCLGVIITSEYDHLSLVDLNSGAERQEFDPWRILRILQVDH